MKKELRIIPTGFSEQSRFADYFNSVFIPVSVDIVKCFLIRIRKVSKYEYEE